MINRIVWFIVTALEHYTKMRDITQWEKSTQK